MTSSIDISPETKVGDLLEAYPELEEVLIEIAPMFAKLRNPVLRRTIAKVTTLERAAAVAGIPARDLVASLQGSLGMSVDEVQKDSEGTGTEDVPLPEWVDLQSVVWTLDADSLLEANQHPISEVKRRASNLNPGEIGLIRSSFRPAPLIDVLAAQGIDTATHRSSSGFHTYVRSA